MGSFKKGANAWANAERLKEDLLECLKDDVRGRDPLEAVKRHGAMQFVHERIIFYRTDHCIHVINYVYLCIIIVPS